MSENEKEVWKEIPGFSNYEINIDGIVRRKSDKFIPKYNITYKGIFLKSDSGEFRRIRPDALLNRLFYAPDEDEVVDLSYIGFPDYYLTCDGKIWSKRFYKWMSYRVVGRGYLGISLYKDKKNIDFLMHRLVALTFIPNPFNKETVNHIDGNKTNNCVLNLEWTTHLENNNHAIYNDLRNCLQTEDVHRICKYLRDNPLLTTAEIANFFGYSWSKIGDIRNRKTWTHISNEYDW